MVCSAKDAETNTNVAIKKIPKAFQDLVDAKRVLREIKILSKIIISELIFLTHDYFRVLRP